MAAQEPAAVERDLLDFSNVLVGESRVDSLPRREVVGGPPLPELLDLYRETVMLRQAGVLQGLQNTVFIDSFEDADRCRPLLGSFGGPGHSVLALRRKSLAQPSRSSSRRRQRRELLLTFAHLGNRRGTLAQTLVG